MDFGANQKVDSGLRAVVFENDHTVVFEHNFSRRAFGYDFTENTVQRLSMMECFRGFIV